MINDIGHWGNGDYRVYIASGFVKDEVGNPSSEFVNNEVLFHVGNNEDRAQVKISSVTAEATKKYGQGVTYVYFDNTARIKCFFLLRRSANAS